MIIELGRPAFPDATTYFTSTYEAAVLKPPDPPLHDPFAFTLSCIKRVETDTSWFPSQEFQRGEKFPLKSQHLFFVVLRKIVQEIFAPFPLLKIFSPSIQELVFVYWLLQKLTDFCCILDQAVWGYSCQCLGSSWAAPVLYLLEQLKMLQTICRSAVKNIFWIGLGRQNHFQRRQCYVLDSTL